MEDGDVHCKAEDPLQHGPGHGHHQKQGREKAGLPHFQAEKRVCPGTRRPGGLMRRLWPGRTASMRRTRHAKSK